MTLLSGKRKEKERKRVYAQIKLPTFQPTALAFFRANTCACMSQLVALGQGLILYIYAASNIVLQLNLAHTLATQKVDFIS